jgi:flagellar basal body P-ring protein FlgI
MNLPGISFKIADRDMQHGICCSVVFGRELLGQDNVPSAIKTEKVSIGKCSLRVHTSPNLEKTNSRSKTLSRCSTFVLSYNSIAATRPQTLLFLLAKTTRKTPKDLNAIPRLPSTKMMITESVSDKTCLLAS